MNGFDLQNGQGAKRKEANPPRLAERFFRLAEVRQQVGVSRATLWRWIAERGLRVVRVGGVTRIRESDLQAFLERHESNPQPEAAAHATRGDVVTSAP